MYHAGTFQWDVSHGMGDVHLISPTKPAAFPRAAGKQSIIFHTALWLTQLGHWKVHSASLEPIRNTQPYNTKTSHQYDSCTEIWDFKKIAILLCQSPNVYSAKSHRKSIFLNTSHDFQGEKMLLREKLPFRQASFLHVGLLLLFLTREMLKIGYLEPKAQEKEYYAFLCQLNVYSARP